MVTKVAEQPQELDMLDCDNSIERLIVRFNEFKQPSVYSKGSVVLWINSLDSLVKEILRCG